jgi:vancomycin aglycone glucosyltransferase
MSNADNHQHQPIGHSRELSNGKRILIATIGSRGEVQPVLGLANELQALGHRAVICVPPNFKAWVESFGHECISIGPDLQKFSMQSAGAKGRKPTAKQIRQMVRVSVIEQFQVTSEAARGCDLIVVAGDLQHAARSIAELHQIPYVHATYCPVTLKSADHPPPNLRRIGRLQNLPKWINRLLWKYSEWHWNGLYRDVVNDQRALLGLTPVKNVPGYIATERSWLAVDPVVGPPTSENGQTIQTGAWFLSDTRPLPDALEKFLADGEPPIYFGFGSMRAGAQTSRILIDAARAVGRRAIVSQGWANLELIDNGSDCISIGDVSHENLLPRVAAIVHHGGAGTTTAAVRAGKPQVVVPHLYDQFYWAHRVEQLQVGVSAGKAAQLTVDKLVNALRRCITPDMAARSQALARCVELQGARIAGERLVKEWS